MQLIIPTIEDLAVKAEEIAVRFRPTRIVLFGSYAYGSPTPDSDVDLLVEMETDLPNVDQAVEIRKGVEFPFPVDLLVRTPREIQERVGLGDAFVRDILTRGKVLYDANLI